MDQKPAEQTSISRHIELALQGLRLLKSLDAPVLERTYRTNVLQLDHAILWLQALKLETEAVATDAQSPGINLKSDEPLLAAQFQRELRELLKKDTDYLSKGKAMDYADYKRVVGSISGLQRAMERYGDLLSRADKAI